MFATEVSARITIKRPQSGYDVRKSFGAGDDRVLSAPEAVTQGSKAVERVVIRILECSRMSANPVSESIDKSKVGFLCL